MKLARREDRPPIPRQFFASLDLEAPEWVEGVDRPAPEALVGCVPSSNEKPGTPFCEDGCEVEPANNNNNPAPTNNTTTPQELPELKGAFVSGHLGSYWDCPDEAYDGLDADADGIASDGACAPGSECPSFSSCETAQITISLSNGGGGVATNVLVDQIEAFTVDGESRATFPLLATIDTETNEAFDGNLEPGEEVLLRIEFQGPLNPYELLAPSPSADGDRAAGGGGIIETTFSADHIEDLVVESGEIYGVPQVDT